MCNFYQENQDKTHLVYYNLLQIHRVKYFEVIYESNA